MRINQRWFVWVLLGLCVIAIPVGILAAIAGGSLSKDGGDSDFLAPSSDRIQVIKLTGMIVDQSESSVLSSSNSSSSCLKSLRKFLKKDQIKAVLLRINSPGGTVSQSQELNEAVTALVKKDKIVYVSMGDVAASGGYYTACAANRIYADPGTLTGSIGVIMNLINIKTLADKIGVQPNVIKSGEFKDMGSMFRPSTPEEHAILQALIADSYDQFVTTVARGRKMNVDVVKKIADGRVYTGRQAKQNGLVDELGSYDDAIAGLQKACRDKYKLDKDLPVDDKSTEGILGSILSALSGDDDDSSSSIGFIKALTAPRLTEAGSQLLPESFSNRFYKQPLWILQ